MELLTRVSRASNGVLLPGEFSAREAAPWRNKILGEDCSLEAFPERNALPVDDV